MNTDAALKRRSQMNTDQGEMLAKPAAHLWFKYALWRQRAFIAGFAGIHSISG
jgi:hypothetical protein